MAVTVVMLAIGAPSSSAWAAEVNPSVSVSTSAGKTTTTFTWFARAKKKSGYWVCAKYNPFLVEGATATTSVAPSRKTQKVPFQRGKGLVMKRIKKGTPVCQITATRSGRNAESSEASNGSPAGGSSTQPATGGSSSSAPADAGAFTVPTVTLAKVVTRPVEAADFRATAGMDPSVTTVIETTYRLSGGTFQTMNPWTGRTDIVRGEDYLVRSVLSFDGMCVASGRGITVYPISGPIWDLDRAQTIRGPLEVPGYSRTATDYTSCNYGG